MVQTPILLRALKKKTEYENSETKEQCWTSGRYGLYIFKLVMQAPLF